MEDFQVIGKIAMIRLVCAGGTEMYSTIGIAGTPHPQVNRIEDFWNILVLSQVYHPSYFNHPWITIELVNGTDVTRFNLTDGAFRYNKSQEIVTFNDIYIMNDVTYLTLNRSLTYEELV